MDINRFKLLCLSKSVNRQIMIDDANFMLKTYSALKRVANDTVPLRLHINYPEGQEILRKVGDLSYIRFPVEPIVMITSLDIDRALEDAVALLVMASIETQRAKIYMGLYYTEIENHDVRLMEADLDVAGNEFDYNNSQGSFA